MSNYPLNHGAGSRSNSGTPRFFQALERGQLYQWAYSPEHEWALPITWRDLTGSAATQIVTVTIADAAATVIVSGRLVLTFTGYGLSSPVTVTADAVDGETAGDLATTLEAAVQTARGTTLAAVVSGEVVVDNAVTIEILRGLVGTVTRAFTPAQVTTVTFSGVPVDARYLTNVGATEIEVERASGSPAVLADLAAANEAELEAGLLTGVLVSGDASGAVNTLLFEPGVTATVTTQIDPLSIDLTFGGTATDGDYTTRFSHSSLPAGFVDVTTTRAAGSPSTNTDLATQHVADIEADPRLVALIDPTPTVSSGASVTVVAYAGVTGLTAFCFAPAPGTLTRTALAMTVADATPAAPTITVTYAVELALASIGARAAGQGGRGGFPTHVLREEAYVDVSTSFGAGRTMTLGDADAVDGLIGGTPIDLTATVRTIGGSAETEYQPRYEAALAPIATFDLGSSATLTQGAATIGIVFSPVPFEPAA